MARNRVHGLNRPFVGSGTTASFEPSSTILGSRSRRRSNSAPSAPNTARRIALRVIRMVDGRTGNGAPSGHVASSRTVSSSTICS
jgi:hypothetical protein